MGRGRKRGENGENLQLQQIVDTILSGPRFHPLITFTPCGFQGLQWKLRPSRHYIFSVYRAWKKCQPSSPKVWSCNGLMHYAKEIGDPGYIQIVPWGAEFQLNMTKHRNSYQRTHSTVQNVSFTVTFTFFQTYRLHCHHLRWMMVDFSSRTAFQWIERVGKRSLIFRLTFKRRKLLWK